MKKIEIIMGEESTHIEGPECEIIDYTMCLSVLTAAVKMMLMEGAGRTDKEATQIVSAVVDDTLHLKTSISKRMVN